MWLQQAEIPPPISIFENNNSKVRNTDDIKAGVKIRYLTFTEILKTTFGRPTPRKNAGYAAAYDRQI